MAQRKKRFRIFVRSWWKWNAAWPGGREPHATGRKHTIAWADTEQEARAIAQEYNRTHNPGPLSRKAEFCDLS